MKSSIAIIRLMERLIYRLQLTMLVTIINKVQCIYITYSRKQMLDQIQTDQRLAEHNQFVSHVRAHAQEVHQQRYLSTQLYLVGILFFVKIVPPFRILRYHRFSNAFNAVFDTVRCDVLVIAVRFRRTFTTTVSATSPETKRNKNLI